MAVGKFKLVRREGIDLIKKQLNIELDNEICVFEANDMSMTKCRQCVINCFEYLKCKERIKNDTKILKGLMKTESFENDPRFECELSYNDENKVYKVLIRKVNIFAVKNAYYFKWLILKLI